MARDQESWATQGLNLQRTIEVSKDEIDYFPASLFLNRSQM
jgi:hypothetical protein